VLVAGDYQHPVQNRSVTPQCRWLGSLGEPEMQRLFAAASIYALPALYEPFGYTPLEAALSGCALVLGDIASLREIWGDAAVFVDPHDSRSLKAELLVLVADSNHRHELAERARARALQFTSARMAENYFGAYAELLESKAVDEQEELAQCA
jgi:glycosyltransferase involved in cell wall biosynthesis